MTETNVEQTENAEDIQESTEAQENTFTREEVDELLAEYVHKDEVEKKMNQRIARLKKSPNWQPAKRESEKKSSTPSNDNITTEPSLREYRAFDRAVGKYDLSERQYQVLEDYFLKERPEDIKEWAGELVSDLGWEQKPDGNVRTETETKQPKRTGKPSTDSGAPNGGSTLETTGDPLLMQPGEYEQIVAQKGPEAAQRYIYQKVRQGLRR